MKKKIENILLLLLLWVFQNILWVILVFLIGYIVFSIYSDHPTIMLGAPTLLFIGIGIVKLIISRNKEKKYQQALRKAEKKREIIDFRKTPSCPHTWIIVKHSYSDSVWRFNFDELEIDQLSEDACKLKWKNPADTRDLNLVLDHIRTRGTVLFGVSAGKKIYSFTTLFQDSSGNTYIEWIKYENGGDVAGGITDYYVIPAGWDSGYQKINPETNEFL